MSTNKCLICESEEFTELLNLEQSPVIFWPIPKKKLEDVKSFPLVIAICNDCSLVQQINLLDENILNEIFQETDYYGCPSPIATGMGTREINKFYSFFQNCRLSKGKILEIACSDGFLLSRLQKDGWDIFGCDPSSITKIAIDDLGKDRIINDFFKENTFPRETFEVIIFRNLLEHLYDIHGFLDAVTISLKTGGRIFVDVPNVSEILKIGGFGAFFHHVSYFSINTLSYFLSLHGYVIEKSFEGTPNLFTCAIKEPKSKNSSLPSRKIKIEKGQYLEANRKIKHKINEIFDDNSHREIALFGASALATAMINFLKPNQLSKIKYIFDNDSQKFEKIIFGCDVTIHPPDQIKNSEFDLILITTYFFENEIKEQLQDLGVNQNKIITFS